MHSWGDKWRFWDELYEAQAFIMRYVKTRSGCYLMCKEKWGKIRYEYVIPPGTSPFIIRQHIGEKIVSFLGGKKKYLWEGEIHEYPRWHWNDMWFNRLWRWWGYKMLGRAVRKACLKWPPITDELMCDAAGHDLFSDRIRSYYWTRYTPEESGDDGETTKK